MRKENPLDEFVIERVLVSQSRGLGDVRRPPGNGVQSEASAAFSVALGRIAADALASSGK